MRNATIFVIALIGIMGGLAIDLFFDSFVGADSPPHYVEGFYGQPYWGGAYPLKTLLAVLSTICFAVAMMRFKPSTERQRPRERLTPRARAVIWGVFLLSGVFSAMFLFSPWQFYALAKEDGIIESLSAVMWFLACGVSMYMFHILRRAKVKPRLLYLLPTAGLAFVCLFIGMEEVSWFQRILSFETPEAFAGNTQGELNLHNLHSGLFDHAYYFAAFLFLILLPFVQERTGFLNRFRYLEFFVPSRTVVMASVVLVAYNYYVWNFQLIQVSFFSTLFILAYYAWALRSQGRSLLPAILFGGLVAIQVLFLFNPRHLIIFWEHHFFWDVAEYKEFFIALSFLIYSLDVLQGARKLPQIASG